MAFVNVVFQFVKECKIGHFGFIIIGSAPDDVGGYGHGKQQEEKNDGRLDENGGVVEMENHPGKDEAHAQRDGFRDGRHARVNIGHADDADGGYDDEDDDDYDDDDF